MSIMFVVLLIHLYTWIKNDTKILNAKKKKKKRSCARKCAEICYMQLPNRIIILLGCSDADICGCCHILYIIVTNVYQTKVSRFSQRMMLFFSLVYNYGNVCKNLGSRTMCEVCCGARYCLDPRRMRIDMLHRCLFSALISRWIYA
jgi:hypothetical protein